MTAESAVPGTTRRVNGGETRAAPRACPAFARRAVSGLSRRLVAARLALAGFVLALPASAFAHPIHRSIAEADYNRTTHMLEVALRVFADDFEAALSARAKKKISLEKTPAEELETLARAYLAEKFTVRTADGHLATLRWVGRELKDAENELWFTFEVPLLGGVAGTRVRHAVLADQFRDQLNSVLVRDGPRSVSLVFLSSYGEKPVRFRP